MREYFEALELSTLSPLALKSRFSKGRLFSEPQSPNRTCFQRDRDRIIHSKSFRRLKHKTQVFVATESDHFRSRLTHTLEVSQISRHIGRLLRLNEDVCEAVALAHDLGHTPFGHAGERTLNELLKPQGGFEHNLQSLRVVDLLEQKYPQFPGLNLSFEVRHGLMKHQTPWDKPDDVKDHFVSLEAQVVNLADEISYNNHDIDDGLSAGILVDADLQREVVLWSEAKTKIKQLYTNLEESQLKYLINSHLISSQITDVVQTAEENIKNSSLQSLEDLQRAGKHHLVTFSAEMQEKAKELRKYLFKTFYSHPNVYRMNRKGQQIIRDLFHVFTQDVRLLPQDYQARVSPDYPKERVVADYIAGMTDVYAQKEHTAIFA